MISFLTIFTYTSNNNIFSRENYSLTQLISAKCFLENLSFKDLQGINELQYYKFY